MDQLMEQTLEIVDDKYSELRRLNLSMSSGCLSKAWNVLNLRSRKFGFACSRAPLIDVVLRSTLSVEGAPAKLFPAIRSRYSLATSLLNRLLHSSHGQMMRR